MLSTFQDSIAVVTGGGTGMGRELVRKLSAAGAHVAACDTNAENLAQTISLATEQAASGVRLSAHSCDVSDLQAVDTFAQEVAAQHDTDHINALFNNAGIAGGASFVLDSSREAWEKTFAVCWGGVYNGCRSFMPMLIASEAGALINTSSINGFWATVGPSMEHTAYCSAKFAVKGFTEAMMIDLALNAPHVSAHVVMPGHIGTSIVANSTDVHGGTDYASVRKRMAQMGLSPDSVSDEEIDQLMAERSRSFLEDAPTSAAAAADTIMSDVLAGRWRILVGDDAYAIDEAVRDDPEAAYSEEFLEKIVAAGHLDGLAANDG